MTTEKPDNISDLDWLMSMDPVELSAHPEAIDAIIAYQRKHRQNLEMGVKPKKDTGPKMSLDGVLDSIKPKGPTVTRRI